MAPITWLENPSVKEALEKEPFTFEFDQAVYVLERLYNKKLLDEERTSLEKTIRIKSHVSLSPPSAELQRLELSDCATLWVNFLSIAGIQGPLPTPYTEMVLERNRSRDTGFQDFLDVFNHRLATLWYKFRQQQFLARAQVFPEESVMGACILNLAGIDHNKSLEGEGLTSRILLTYFSLFWSSARSAEGLIRLLSHFFKESFTAQQCEGSWTKGPREALTLIGTKQGQHHALGQTAILGDRTWHQAKGFRITTSPLSWETFCSFLPGSENRFNLLKNLILFYAGFDHSITLTLVLNKWDARPVQLNRDFSLGHNSWLKNRDIRATHPEISVNIQKFD